MSQCARYTVRDANTAEDVRAAQRLRGLAFRGSADASDADALDATCRHILVERSKDGALVACFRLLPLPSGAAISESYAAQYYDLTGLSKHDGPLLEMGRFCVHPDARDPAILRLAWGALGAIVTAERTRMLFGCTSFPGIDSAPYSEAFALLRSQHLGPRRWLPRIKAPAVLRFNRAGRGIAPDKPVALRAMPPLLRSYLAMGGWVSDHAVVDRDLGTLHVFTGLDIASIPVARARALAALGAGLSGGEGIAAVS